MPWCSIFSALIQEWGFFSNGWFDLYVRRFVSRDMSQWVCMRLISNELLVSSDALHKHASIALNCYTIEFCKAWCPSLFFVCSRTIAIFVVFCVFILWIFLFFILVVDVRISGIRVLLRFVGNGFFDVLCVMLPSHQSPIVSAYSRDQLGFF